jgi:hypothetical protein
VPSSYSLVWPDLVSLTPEEEAAVALKRTESIVKFVQGGGEAIMTPLDFYTRILQVPADEALAVVAAAAEAATEREEEEPTEEGEDQFDEDEDEEP